MKKQESPGFSRGEHVNLADLYDAARAAHQRTLATTQDPFTRGKAEGRVIGVALALDTIRQETRR